MKKEKKYIASDGIEYFMCPFEKMYISQGSGMNGGTYSHNGTMANDVTNGDAKKVAYYSPCTCKLIWCDVSNGQGIWQSVNKVRFANGVVDYATFVTCHDETFNAKVGWIIPQGNQIGNMGKKGNATGVHCHIQIAQGKYTIKDWKKNKYGIYCFPNEYDTDDCYFVDDTEILNGMGGSWKKISQVKVPVPTSTQIKTKPYIESCATYELISAKLLRLSPSISNNVARAENIDAYTKKYLTSQRGQAQLRKGFRWTATKVVKSGGRYFASYGNCFICIQNIDGTHNAKRID